MRRYNYISILFLSALLCGSMASCTAEPLFDEGNDASRGKGVKVAFSLVVPDAKEVVAETATRSTYENTIGNVFLLVFDENETFIEVQPASEATGEYNYIASLAPQSRKCLIYVVANVPIIMDRAKNNWITGTTTLDDIKTSLLKDRLPGSDSSRSIMEVPALPPLSSVLAIEVNGISASTTLTDEIMMERATAKITVTTSSAGFVVYGANLCDAPVRGYVFAGMPFGTIGKADYWGPDGAGGYSPESMIRHATEANPLYSYESPDTHATYLIIKASYKGIDGYYRINLKDKDKKQLALQRNYRYSVHIKKIQTTGYRTATEAKANTALNDLPGSDVEVDVSDGYSHDIVSNGEYYLGVENSEFIIYSQRTVNDESVTKVFWNAPATVARGGVTYQASDIDGNPVHSGIVVTDCFSGNNSSVQSGDLKISLPDNVIQVSIRLRLGNLEKTINVTRKTDNLSFGEAIMFEPAYIWGRIAYNSASYQWASLSKNMNAEVFEGSHEMENPDGTANLYLLFASNLTQNTDHGDREATIYMARANESGRTKIKVLQPEIDIFDKAKSPIANPYVGAFWRHSETGERVIRMYNGQGNTASTGNSIWFAEVASGKEFIKLLPGGSTDGAIYSSAPGNAEQYQVYNLPDAKLSIRSKGDMVFRIGLKNTIQANEHRYGVVLVHHDGGTERIFIRQGEAPDFLYRPKDPVLGNWSTHDNNTPRPRTVKLSPYNLTDPQLGLGGTDANFYYGNHNAMPLDYHSERIATSTFDKKKLTRYPSQAGYFFIWSVLEQPLTGTNYPYYMGNQNVPFKDEWQWVRAVHPLRVGNMWGTTTDNPSGTWTANTYAGNYNGNGDKGIPMYGNATYTSFSFTQIGVQYTKATNPCPRGYRYPHAGEVETSGAYATKYAGENAYFSEIGQSMFYDPKLSNDAQKMSQYTLWGYYADGFFDRHKIVGASGTTPASYSMVVHGDIANATGNDIGYMGSLTFNPFNYASIFHPAPGYWLYELREAGAAYNYWTMERLNYLPSNPGIALSLNARKTYFAINSGYGLASFPMSIRCIRDYSLQSNIAEKNYD